MTKIKMLHRAFVDFCLVLIFSTFLVPLSAAPADLAFANSDGVGSGFPYTQTFKISAYYSPLPCQDRYATGTYAGDIRLNGSGVNGASGHAVYPGMIAAPRTYAFGTKMFVPGVGIVAVYDRGGAIVNAGQRGQAYDRLDVWMGYGDVGLQRALNWGKRNVDVTVYGITDSVVEDVNLPGYVADESSSASCGQDKLTLTNVLFDNVVTPPVTAKSATLDSNLNRGDRGAKVSKLQEELSNFNFYRGEINGEFDEKTEHAVFKFQQSQGLVGDKTAAGSGVFGPKTRDRMQELFSQRKHSAQLVAAATDVYGQAMLAKAENIVEEGLQIADADFVDEGVRLLAKELGYGAVAPEVTLLQRFLKDEGYFDGVFITDYYGLKTQEAVLKFQLDQGVVNDRADRGAGRVGPSTLEVINAFG
ncbi:peptidoglycan-binding protein [Candidatus Gracilibacteria bacterium]|nr:peptidoglycan-binding protein [Candidatus Gracilibacteria bacterium]